MRRFASIYLLIVLILTGACSRDSLVGIPEEEAVSFEICLNEATRASLDNDGQAANVNRCVLQIWEGDQIYKTVVRTAPSGTRLFNFKGVLLEVGHTYDFLFWADCGTASGEDLYYSTASLKNVSIINPSVGNTDAADAFCNRVLGKTIDDEYDTRLVLTRPLSQLNIIASDLPRFSEVPTFADFKPVSIGYSYNACTAFNVHSNSCVGPAELITTSDLPIYGPMEIGSAPADSCTLAMNYLFPPDGESVSKVEMTVKSINGASVVSTFDNVPFKRNWRTNIRGNILTVIGNYSVVVDPLFLGELE